MGTFIIIEMRAHDVTWEVEASSIEEARRLFDKGEGEEIDCQPYDDNGVIQIVDPCGDTVFERLTPAEQAIRNIHDYLDGREWQAEFLDLIAGEIEAAGYKVRNPLVECDLCGEDAVEENAEQYVMPIDLHGPDDEYLAEAGDHLNVCPDCQTAVNEQAERERRGL